MGSTSNFLLCAVVASMVISFVVADCPDGWLQAGNSCYKTSPDSMNWYQAEQWCYLEGGYLVEIETEDEMVNLYSVAPFGLNYWIGLTDFATEGNFVWQSRFTVAEYFYWAFGGPTDSGVEDCVALWDPENFQWQDLDCYRADYETHALCETPAI